MFCPNCGKENNIQKYKFCASCGTNLEAVSRVLYTSSVGIYTRFDNALNQFIARYAERVFKASPSNALSRKLSENWKVLGQGILTAPVDFILFWLMLFGVFPLRILTLLVATPFRLLTDNSSSNRQKEWPAGLIVSAVEHTTDHLADYQPPERSRDSLKE